jgi:hypothetical protein
VLPIEGVMLVGLMVWLLKGTLKGSLDVPRSQLTRSLIAFWLVLLLGLGIGMSHGGKFHIALWEVRPWICLTVTYLLASAFLTTRLALRAVLWTLVLGTGFKGLQGVQIFFSYARHLDPRPEAILDHAESFFFGLYIFLALALWLFGQRGRLRVIATCLLPVVVIADLANARRTASAILFAALAMLLVTSWVALPHKRRMLRILLVGLVIASTVYFPAYWNHDGTLAQPARAVRSAISPSQRDLQSNLYRTEENANLVYNIRTSSKLGKGFGIPINYALPITDISRQDPMIKYVPHDGLLWIWMRIGLLGEIVFWVLIGASVIKSLQLLRSTDKELALYGAVTAFAVIALVIQGYNDLGLYNLRITAAVGCLLGCLESASRLAVPRGNPPAPAARERRSRTTDAMTAVS